MIKFILENPGKALWMLLCFLAIAYLEMGQDLKFILCGWSLFPPFVLHKCEERNIPHKWRWAVANFLLPWIAIWVFIILHGNKEKRHS